MAMKQNASALRGDIAGDALKGLSQPRKTLPPKLFYDEAGCRLFERITALPEYYITRTELSILQSSGDSIRQTLPSGACLVEYGASSSLKAGLVLDSLQRPHAYIPIDIAPDALAIVHTDIGEKYPDLVVAPICADFLRPLHLPAFSRNYPCIGFFPGSTIGNLDPAAATEFLRMARATLGEGARFLVGADLRKDKNRLLAAYDDAQGVTAAFNLNLLARLNREACADFNLEYFVHRAVWNSKESRIEMHLVSLADQTVRIGSRKIDFAAGESIHTENSYKHAPEAFNQIARSAGWQVTERWTDPEGLFSISLLDA